jgi:hypothetical protein
MAGKPGDPLVCRREDIGLRVGPIERFFYKVDDFPFDGDIVWLFDDLGNGHPLYPVFVNYLGLEPTVDLHFEVVGVLALDGDSVHHLPALVDHHLLDHGHLLLDLLLNVLDDLALVGDVLFLDDGLDLFRREHFLEDLGRGLAGRAGLAGLAGEEETGLELGLAGLAGLAALEIGHK